MFNKILDSNTSNKIYSKNLGKDIDKLLSSREIIRELNKHSNLNDMLTKKSTIEVDKTENEVKPGILKISKTKKSENLTKKEISIILKNINSDYPQAQSNVNEFFKNVKKLNNEYSKILPLNNEKVKVNQNYENNIKSKIQQYQNPKVGFKINEQQPSFKYKKSFSIVGNDSKNNIAQNSNFDEKYVEKKSSRLNSASIVSTPKRRISKESSVNLNFFNSNFNKHQINKDNNNFFCPYCEHCNPIKDDNFESTIKNIFPEINQSKNLLKSYFDFILTNDLISLPPSELFGIKTDSLKIKRKIKKTKLTRIKRKSSSKKSINQNSSISNSSFENVSNSENDSSQDEDQTNNKKSVIKNNSYNKKHKITEFKNFFEKNKSSKNQVFLNKITKKCLSQNLNAILKNPDNMKHLLPIELIHKIEKNTLSVGLIGNLNNKTLKNMKDNYISYFTNFEGDEEENNFRQVQFDIGQDIKELLTPGIRKIIKSLHLNKYYFNIAFDDDKTNDEICDAPTKHMRISKLQNQVINFNDDKKNTVFVTDIVDKTKKKANLPQFIKLGSRKKRLIMYSIFLSILHLLFMEQRETSVLLYKFFKYFIKEIEITYLYKVNKLVKKLEFYEDICKASFIKDNPDAVKEVEGLTDLLFVPDITEENINKHKNAIKQLIEFNTKLQNNIYILKGELDSKIKELNLYFYKYDEAKVYQEIKENLRILDDDKIIEEIKLETEGRNIKPYQFFCLVNSDRFLNISGQRNFIYDQKKHYISEIGKLHDYLSNAQFLNRDLRNELETKNIEFEKINENLKEELFKLREKLNVLKEECGSQTDIDLEDFKVIDKNLHVMKVLESNKKHYFYEYIQKYNFNICKEQPISKSSLLYLIPEIFTEKSDLDYKSNMSDLPKLSLDHFMHDMFVKRFKLSKLVERNLESSILACYKYSEEDYRIDLFSRFLGIKEKNFIRREVLDIYLITIRSTPFTFFECYSDKYEELMISTEVALEILYSKFPEYYLIYSVRDLMIKLSSVYSSTSKEQNKKKDQQLDFLIGESEVAINLQVDAKIFYFYLNRVFSRYYFNFNDILEKFKRGDISHGNFKDFFDCFMHSNKDLYIKKDTINEIIKKYFEGNINDNTYSLEKLAKFFKSEKFKFKIKLKDFIEIVLRRMTNLYENIQKDLEEFYLKEDLMKNNSLDFNIYEKYLQMMFDKKAIINSELLNLIKINRINIPFVTKHEFIYNLLNIRKVHKEIIKKYCISIEVKDYLKENDQQKAELDETKLENNHDSSFFSNFSGIKIGENTGDLQVNKEHV